MKKTAGVLGGLYALGGLLGFLVTGFGGTGTLAVFNLSTLGNLIHLAVGLLGLAGYAAGGVLVRWFARTAGIALALLALVGVVVSNPLGVLPLGGADILLHGLSALVLLYLGFDAGPNQVAAIQ